MASVKDLTFKTIAQSVANSVSDVLASSDFISRTIGMNNSYEDIMFIVQALGREPISLLGKDYAFIYDHVRRNYMQGMDIPSKNFEYCNKFTFYKEVPTVRFADPYNDPMNLLDRWKPNFSTLDTSIGQTTLHYSESNDGYTNNKSIGNQSDLENANPGTAHGSIESYQPTLQYCDMVGKTNSNFNHGKYNTLIARFHTNSEDSKSQNDPTQSANTNKYGQSHGRNLLKITPSTENGYNNPYCRVWTYHHQYNQVKRQIRPLGDTNSQVSLESLEKSGNYDTVGFRTVPNKAYGFDSGSKRLDNYGVLNYRNGTVNIAPTAKIKDYFEHKDNDYEKNVISTKKCMFSIENLAWRDDKMRKDEFDAYGLSPEQKGPLGGRIMWFPPYNLKFSENVNVDWNPNKFIGRGENVYTYTNTERRGDLSFTLLIDHPSILDYWTGHERNGMKNQGKSLDSGNIGGVDNIYNQENTLLRFFAGCEILSAKPQEYKTREYKPEEGKEPPKPKVDTPPPPDVPKEKVKKAIYCFAFYPNNYSGKDDGNGIVNPIHYLLNGIGTQKRVNEIAKRTEDFAVDMTEKANAVTTNPFKTIENCGGYEMRKGDKAISIVKNVLDNTGSFNIYDKFANTFLSGTNVQYLTNENGGRVRACYGCSVAQLGVPTILLAKQIGSTAMSLGSGFGHHGQANQNITNKPYEWYRKRWYYRVDEDTANQKLLSRESYLDTKSYSYNSTGIYDCPFIQKEFKLDINKKTERVVSLTDMYTALEGDSAVSDLANSENVNIIKDLINNKDRFEIKAITFFGHASSQGNNKSQKVNKTRNEGLSKYRALTLKNWMAKNNFPKMDIATYEYVDGVQKNGDKYDVNDPVTKFWRSAYVKIEYEEESVENAATAEPTKVKSNGVPTTTRVEVKNNETSRNNYIDAYDWLHNSAEGKALMASNPELASRTRLDGISMDEISKITRKNYLDQYAWNYDDSYLQNGITLKESIVKRYDNEGEFFQALTEKDPFLHHLITDKIKYFDPAFHSISPEGFNARLTFLHQCTRQGSTVGNADNAVQTSAYNLSFGRPPVCVLRIGDFYYTKIIINSMTIQYDQPQWDMNQEGIGMMPMYADISINFTFLGGSDLAGPIARLQNAVSFNYYANASVYDNRAEKVEYDPNGSGREIKFKGYDYPNRYSGDRLNRGRIGEEDNQGGIYAEEEF